ncbi:MAG: hypothetical protein ABNO50_00090 [Candidatus Shikimatogenerans sp. Tduv]|uniref:Uncharacterized protein n=1 Tax=Candidatus Shikimatogenerans sp. Tduv TaxID=3158567 RepID=A0AAU7QQZ6_9FLAO
MIKNKNKNNNINYYKYNIILKKNFKKIKEINLLNEKIINNVLVFYTKSFILTPYILSYIIIKNMFIIYLINLCIKYFIPIVFIHKKKSYYGVLIYIYKIIYNKNYITLLIYGIAKVQIKIIKNYINYNISNIIIYKNVLLTSNILKENIKNIKKIAIYINNIIYKNYIIKNIINEIPKNIKIIYYISFFILDNTKYKQKIFNAYYYEEKILLLEKYIHYFLFKHILCI